MKASRTTGNVKAGNAARGTYVYCLVAGAKAPSRRRVAKGLTGLGPVRLVPVPDAGPARQKLWLVAADAPLDRFNETSINGHLCDLEWVSRAAVAHEGVVESFIGADAVLPMKLFTIFISDERAAGYVASGRPHIDGVLERVLNHDEWGVRVVLDAVKIPAPKRTAVSGGASYLTRKKTQRDARSELVEHSKTVVAELYGCLAGEAGHAKRRTASEMPVKDGPLLLDAAFLVPRSRASRFRSALARQARALHRRGYQVSLTGPWPPYSFMQDA